MFTGIVEEVGQVTRITPGQQGMTVAISCGTVQEDSRVGDSIMVNGACLTATTVSKDGFTADISPESLRVTTLGALSAGSRVNLERSMALGGRLGGHLVSGHIDGVGTVRSIRAAGESTEIWFDAPKEVVGLSVTKGSIAVEGISLTINKVDAGGFSVMIIPHTATATTLLDIGPGGKVNLEADLIGKYVARLLEGYGAAGAGGLSAADLMKL